MTSTRRPTDHGHLRSPSDAKGLRGVVGRQAGAGGAPEAINQVPPAYEEATRALADGSIDAADTSLWDTLPTQEWNPGE